MEQTKPPWYVVILATFAFLLFFGLFIGVSEKYTKNLMRTEKLMIVLNEQNKELSSIRLLGKQDSLLVLCLAIINVESNFNKDVHRKQTNAAGLLQITPIYVEEVNKYSNYKFTLEDRFDINKSIAMFIIFNKKHNPTLNIDRAIYLHNPKADPSYKKTILTQFNTIYSILNTNKK